MNSRIGFVLAISVLIVLLIVLIAHGVIAFLHHDYLTSGFTAFCAAIAIVIVCMPESEHD